MIPDDRSRSNLAFVYAMVITPVLERWRFRDAKSPLSLATDYSVLESALWLKLALDANYVHASHVQPALNQLEPILLASCNSILEAPSEHQLDVREWCEFIGIGTHGPELKRDVFFSEDDTFRDEENTIVLEYQNYLLLCSETIYDQPADTFLAALNLASDEGWKRIMSGDVASYGLGGTDFPSTTAQLLEFLLEIADPEQRLAPLNSRVRNILRWKVNLGNVRVAERFSQACRLVIQEATHSVGELTQKMSWSYMNFLLSYIYSFWTDTVVSYSSSEGLDRTVEELELSVRTYDTLKSANIGNLRDLVQRSETDLLNSGFSRKSVEEIKEILKPMGLRLGMISSSSEVSHARERTDKFEER